MQIDDNLISYLEDLSCLALADGEKSRLKGDLSNITAHMAQLGQLNTGGAKETCSPFDNVNVFRDDEVRPSLDRGLLLKNAPLKNEEMFIAPKTVE